MKWEGMRIFKREEREGKERTKDKQPRQPTCGPRVVHVDRGMLSTCGTRGSHVGNMVGHLANLALTNTLRVLRPFSGLRTPILNPSSDYES